ncbi:MAG: hypothetical protein V1798_07075, partial [Pseudomonadota bacterium]
TQGERALEKVAERQSPDLGAVALCGLASSAFWSNDPCRALFWVRRALTRHPMTAASVWCSSLAVLIFRTLGMRRERFEAEQERFLIMRRIAFHADDHDDRIYALVELKKECESRDLPGDVERCDEELADLIRANGHKVPVQLA